MYNRQQNPTSTLPRIAALDGLKSTIAGALESLGLNK
jgi:hypothetical protein